MFQRSTAVVVVLGVLMAAGCGQTGQVSPNNRTPVTGNPGNGAPVYPTPGYGNPGQGVQPGLQTGMQPGGAVSQLPMQLQQIWMQVRTLSATYDLYEKGAKGTETAKVKFYFKKPGKYRYEVSQHSSSLKNGSKSVFDTHTRQIESRLGGVASFLPIKGTLDDERSLSTRNYTLDQTDYATQTELLFAAGAQVQQRGPLMLELARPSRYPGIEVMRVTLDPQKLLPTTFELVERGQVVYRKRITGIQVNPSLGADKFTL